MRKLFNIKSRKKLGLLGALLLAGVLVLTGCRSYGAVPHGWSGATVEGNTVFVGSKTGSLVAVNLSNNSLMYSVPLPSDAPPKSSFSCVPSSNTTVAIYGSPSVGTDLVYLGGYNGKVYAFNKDKAQPDPQWVYPRDTSIGGVIVGGVVYNSGKVYFGADTGYVYSLDAETGAKNWEFKTGDKVWSTPTVDGSTVYIGSFDKNVYAINTADGTEKWHFATGGGIISQALVYNNTVYIGSFDRNIYAIDASNGNLKWKFEGGKWFWAEAVAANGNIYAANLDGKVYVLDAATGNKKAAIDFGAPISSSPVLVGNSLVVATEAVNSTPGAIFTLDTTSNTKKQILALHDKEGVDSPLTSTNESVYIHTTDNRLIEINVQSNAQRELNIGN